MSHHEPEDGQEDGDHHDVITIKPRGLQIVWGKDNRYWQLPNPGTEEPAELKQVCWLEITGSVVVDVDKKYSIQFEVSKKSDAFGWNGCPVFMMAKVGKKGKYTWIKITSFEEKKDFNQPFLIPEKKESGQNCELSMKVEKDDPSSPGKNKIFFGLYEVWTGKWKGGLQIYKAIITGKPL